MIFAHCQVILLAWLAASAWADQNLCKDASNEFLCERDGACIPRNKVCNFVNDCSDGEDERACGACNFEHGPKLGCGIDLLPDRALEWRSSSGTNRAGNSSGERAQEFKHYIRLESQLFQRQIVDKVQLESIEFEPKILLPNLRPTDNDLCTFRFQSRATKSKFDAGVGEFNESRYHNEPLVSIYLIKLASKPTNHSNDYTELASFKVSPLNQWLSQQVKLGSVKTVWTLMILVKARVTSNPLQLSAFEFKDCAPNEVSRLEREVVLYDLKLQCLTGTDKIWCPISGLCLDTGLKCDFNYDCGTIDHSDEMHCSHFAGRCDFEESDLCGWQASGDGGGEWLWAGAKDKRVLVGPHEAKVRAKPRLDHTYLSKQIGGHYMLLNAAALDFGASEPSSGKRLLRLVGPGVALASGAKSCHLRFWLSAAAQLKQHNLTTAQLTVNSQSFKHEALFDGTSDWRRFEVLLFSRKLTSFDELFALKISFGVDTERDMELFDTSLGFLALDDFSFSPGCQVEYRERPPESICSDDQFFCRTPSPVTDTYCIPKSLYCDFKSDCGLASSEQAALELMVGEDEQNCAKSSKQKANNMIKFLLDVIEADKFAISAQVDPSGEDYLEIGESSARDAVAEVGLPQFSMSHGDCLLELDYAWQGEARNMRFTVGLYTDAPLLDDWDVMLVLFRESGPILQASSDDEKRLSRRRVILRVGQNIYPFSVRLNVQAYPQASAQPVNQSANAAFRLYSYSFNACHYQKGLVEDLWEAKVVKLEDQALDDWNADEADYNCASASKHEIKLIDRSCPAGKIQCCAPVVCIDERLRCDMQRDCQLSNIDEMKCAESGYLQIDFEDANKQLMEWLLEANSTLGLGAKFELARSGESLPNTLNYPARDHGQWANGFEKNQHVGSMLILQSSNKSRRARKEPSIGVLYSPRFLASNECAQLTFYLYEWAGSQEYHESQSVNQYRMEILMERLEAGKGKKTLESLGVISSVIKKSKALTIGWRRIEIQLPSGMSANASDARDHSGSPAQSWFTLAFVGQVGGSRKFNLILALDDLTIGPKCVLAANQEARAFSITRAASLTFPGQQRQPTKRICWPRVGLLSLAILVCVAGLVVLARKMRQPEQARRSNSGMRMRGLGEYRRFTQLET